MADKYNLTTGTTAQIQALVDGSGLINGLQYHDSDLGIRYVATGINTLASIGVDLWEVEADSLKPKSGRDINILTVDTISITVESTNNRAINAKAYNEAAIYGEGDYGEGVYGKSANATGVRGDSISSVGVGGQGATGVVGFSTDGIGVRGYSDSGTGVIGESTTGPAGRFGSDTDNTTIEADGTIKFNGAATYFVDIDFPILIRTTGANIPVLATFNGNLILPQWAVDDFNVCESQEFIHGWKEGSTCSMHLHLTTNGLNVDNRYVKFNVEYAYSVAGVWTFPASFTTADILIPANTATKTQIIMPLLSFTPTGSKIGDHCLIRLRRVASTGNAPSANPWIPMVQLHVECDTIGSRTISDK